jgi:hypothetical protein
MEAPVIPRPAGREDYHMNEKTTGSLLGLSGGKDSFNLSPCSPSSPVFTRSLYGGAATVDMVSRGPTFPPCGSMQKSWATLLAQKDQIAEIIFDIKKRRTPAR